MSSDKVKEETSQKTQDLVSQKTEPFVELLNMARGLFNKETEECRILRKDILEQVNFVKDEMLSLAKCQEELLKEMKELKKNLSSKGKNTFVDKVKKKIEPFILDVE